MGPECTSKKTDNTCNKTPNFKDSFISHVICLFVNHLSIVRVINSFHLIKLAFSCILFVSEMS